MNEEVIIQTPVPLLKRIVIIAILAVVGLAVMAYPTYLYAVGGGYIG